MVNEYTYYVAHLDKNTSYSSTTLYITTRETLSHHKTVLQEAIDRGKVTEAGTYYVVAPCLKFQTVNLQKFTVGGLHIG